MMRTAVYAGSFDPPTNGHLWMIEEGSRLFDKLVVAVGTNPDKKPLFSVQERVQLLKELTAGLPNVTVSSFTGQYLVRYAKAAGAGYLLRGVRSGADYGFEQGMRHVNAELEPGVESVFLIPPRELSEVSSSFVKGLVGPVGWQDVVGRYVPAAVRKALAGRVKGR